MGFAYDNYIISEELEELIEYNDSVDVPMIDQSSLAINKSDEKELMPYLNKREINLNDNLDSIVIVRRAVTCDSFSGHTRGSDAHINLDSASVVFFSVVADDGFKAYIYGEPTKIYETIFGFIYVIVPAGSHDITFRYFPTGLKIGLIFSAFGLSLLVFMRYKRF